MDFCKECGSRLEPKKVKSGQQTIFVLHAQNAEKKQMNQVKPNNQQNHNAQS